MRKSPVFFLQQRNFGLLSNEFLEGGIEGLKRCLLAPHLDSSV
jgi:hypothetical protein